MLTEKQIKEVLKTVIDPELFINIVDLGLIYEVKVTEKLKDQKTKKQEYVVFVLMTLTSPGCPLASTFERMVTKAVKEIKEVKEVRVDLTWDPPWNQEMMSEEAKAELGLF